MIDDEEQIFPAVTICIDSIFHASKIRYNCLFNGKQCSFDDFEYFGISKKHFNGLCARFNSFKDSSTSFQKLTSGYSHGLSFVYWLPDSKPLNRSFIYINDNYIKSLEQETSFHQSLNNLYEYKLEKYADEKLGEPYNICGSVRDTTYRRVNCASKCVHENVALKYNCSFMGFYMVGNLEMCENIEQKMNDFEMSCYKKCPRECVSNIYTASIMSIPLNQNKMGLNVYFGRSSFTKTSQLPKMNVAELISGYGGDLGLFMGMSCFSFLEIFSLLLEILFIVLGIL